eukprot:TRINITY_DN9816_c0_g1_i2.p1 TRINITY_DN9816_c0_g1~~TRINITY_DN9816_c0_g1_i2.p1  ORF type:complete len:625 (+),score=87.96 TRINITY_DN9816_c0_g1_i2:54-1928(+)
MPRDDRKAMSFAVARGPPPWPPASRSRRAWGVGAHSVISFVFLPSLAFAIMDPTDEERRLAWKYPDCAHLEGRPERKIDWPGIRRRLHTLPYDDIIDVVMEVVQTMKYGGADIDEEARSCFMGIPTVFFYLCIHEVDVLEADVAKIGLLDPDALKRATMQFSVLENYISVLHPGLVDKANWTVTDSQVSALRRRLLRLYWTSRQANATSQGPVGHTPGMPLSARAAEVSALKIYVYDEDEVPELSPLLQGQMYCGRGQWGSEIQIHDFFLTSDYRTDDPREADFFLVPTYSICALEGNMLTLDEIDQIFKSIIWALPYFNATGGRDHIFVFASGMAHNVFQSWQDFISRSIVLTPETELFNDFAWIAEPPFHTWRDIVIPGSLDLAEVVSLIDSDKPLEQRMHLAAFFGRVDVVRGPHPWVGGADVRRDILQLAELPAADGSGGGLWFGDNATHDIMHTAYGDSRFCFVPRGKSGWSLRFFEALFAGCVPVVISDKWELPFEDFLDVTRFVIKWPSTHVGNGLLEYLRALPDTIVQRYMEEGRRARCWYFYPPKRLDVRADLRRNRGICLEQDGKDVFKGILRSLRKRQRVSKTSFASFFFPDASGQLIRTDGELRPLSGNRLG